MGPANQSGHSWAFFLYLSAFSIPSCLHHAQCEPDLKSLTGYVISACVQLLLRCVLGCCHGVHSRRRNVRSTGVNCCHILLPSFVFHDYFDWIDWICCWHFGGAGSSCLPCWRRCAARHCTVIYVILTSKRSEHTVRLWRPRGPMDKAPDYGSGDSRFESWRGRSWSHTITFSAPWPAHEHSCHIMSGCSADTAFRTPVRIFSASFCVVIRQQVHFRLHGHSQAGIFSRASSFIQLSPFIFRNDCNLRVFIFCVCVCCCCIAATRSTNGRCQFLRQNLWRTIRCVPWPCQRKSTLHCTDKFTWL